MEPQIVDEIESHRYKDVRLRYTLNGRYERFLEKSM